MHEWINTGIMVLVSLGSFFGVGGIQAVIADVKKTITDLRGLHTELHTKLDDAIAKLPKARGVKMAEAAAQNAAEVPAAGDSIPVSVTPPMAPGATW